MRRQRRFSAPEGDVKMRAAAAAALDEAAEEFEVFGQLLAGREGDCPAHIFPPLDVCEELVLDEDGTPSPIRVPESARAHLAARAGALETARRGSANGSAKTRAPPAVARGRAKRYSAPSNLEMVSAAAAALAECGEPPSPLSPEFPDGWEDRDSLVRRRLENILFRSADGVAPTPPPCARPARPRGRAGRLSLSASPRSLLDAASSPVPSAPSSCPNGFLRMLDAQRPSEPAVEPRKAQDPPPRKPAAALRNAPEKAPPPPKKKAPPPKKKAPPPPTPATPAEEAPPPATPVSPEAPAARTGFLRPKASSPEDDRSTLGSIVSDLGEERDTFGKGIGAARDIFFDKEHDGRGSGTRSSATTIVSDDDDDPRAEFLLSDDDSGAEDDGRGRFQSLDDLKNKLRPAALAYKDAVDALEIPAAPKIPARRPGARAKTTGSPGKRRKSPRPPSQPARAPRPGDWL